MDANRNITCYAIKRAKNDRVFKGGNVQCTGFTRTLTDKDLDCCGNSKSARGNGFIDTVVGVVKDVVNDVAGFFMRNSNQKCYKPHPQQPAEQINAATSYLDLSLVYGNNHEQNRLIRNFTGGRL